MVLVSAAIAASVLWSPIFQLPTQQEKSDQQAFESIDKRDSLYFADISLLLRRMPSYDSLQLADDARLRTSSDPRIRDSRIESIESSLRARGLTTDSATPELLYRYVYLLRDISKTDLAALLGSVHPLIGDFELSNDQLQSYAEHKSKVMLLASALLPDTPCAYWKTKGKLLKIDLRYWQKGQADPVYTLEHLEIIFKDRRRFTGYDKSGIKMKL